MEQHKKLLTLAFPLILANVSTPLLGLVDTAILGRLQYLEQMSGAALGALIITQIYWLCGFLKMSITGLSAQNKHASSIKLLSIVVQGTCIAVLIAAMILIFQSLIFTIGMELSDANNAVEQFAGDYFKVRVWGAPITLINIVLIGFLIGMQKTKQVLYLQLIVNCTNAFFSLLLVYAFDLGVIGVALATVIAESLMLLMAIPYTKKCILTKHWSLRLLHKVSIVSLKINRIKRLLTLNGHLFIRNLLLQSTLAFVSFKGAQFGATAIAVNAIILQFFTLIALGLDGIANAVEALVGEQKGRKSEQQIKQWSYIGMIWSNLFALLYCLMFLLLGSFILANLTHHIPVIIAFEQYWIIIFCLPLVAHWCFLFDGIFVGLSRAKAMRNTMLCSIAFGFIPVYWVYADLQNYGLWLAMLGFLLARGASQFVMFYRWSQQSNGLID